MIITKIWNSIFKKYKLSREEKSFIEENKKYWHKNNNNIGIIIEGFLQSPTSVIEKARIAKAIEAKLNISSLVLLRGFSQKSSNVIDIYKSFSISHYVMWWAQYLNLYLFIKIFIKTIYIFNRCSNGEKLLRLKFDDIVIGDLIYDTLIRFNPKSYTVGKLNYKQHFRHIFRAYYSAELYKKLFLKYNIKAVVTSHNVYSEYGILCRLGYKYNADIFLKDMDVFKHYDHSIDVNEHFLKVDKIVYSNVLSDLEVIKSAEKYLESRFDGSANQIDVKNAYRDKITYTKDSLFDFFKIRNNSNKNIFILAHAFSDAPHVGEGILFKDYYSWLVETMKVITKVDGVNIFVKPHPSSYMWNENGAVEEILTKLNISNIYVIPNDFNTNSIKDIADCILTAQGTAGLEFSCFGIPAITVGKGYYSGFGIATEPSTKEEYFTLLNNIIKINKLPEHTQQEAKLLLYLSFQHLTRSEILPKDHIFPGDNFDLKFKEQYEEVSLKLKNGVPIKDNFYDYIYKISKNNDI